MLALGLLGGKAGETGGDGDCETCPHCAEPSGSI